MKFAGGCRPLIWSAYRHFCPAVVPRQPAGMAEDGTAKSLAAGWRARGPVRCNSLDFICGYPVLAQFQLSVPPPGRAPRWWPKCVC